MSKIRIGFVGAGFMGQRAHLYQYALLKQECEVVALAESKPLLAERVAVRYGIPRVYSDYTELLEDGGIDAIVAAQPYRRHSEVIPDLLQAGLPLFTEKPLTLTVEAGERVAALGESLGALHMIGYHKRSDPAMEYAKAVIEQWQASGDYGKLRYVRMTMPPGDWLQSCEPPIATSEPNPEGGLEGDPAEFDEKTARYYDGFVNYYIHQVNALRYMLGEPYRVVHADKTGVLLVGESASGVCAVLEMEPYRTTAEWDESMLIAFEKGYIKVDLPAPLMRQAAGRVTVMRDSGLEPPTLTTPILPAVSAMAKQARNFLAAIRGERPVPCGPREALEDLVVARDYIRARFDGRS